MSTALPYSLFCRPAALAATALGSVSPQCFLELARAADPELGTRGAPRTPKRAQLCRGRSCWDFRAMAGPDIAPEIPADPRGQDSLWHWWHLLFAGRAGAAQEAGAGGLG